ncbi:hypothetical protein AX17_004728 [Amanita inopinata Kibby_2008]|nr:hypothetical protein AX17_004728 [Amanita inopinata Kibby_2008]
MGSFISTSDTQPVASEGDARSQLAKLIKSEDPLTWDLAWKSNITPWEKGHPNPGLCEAVEECGIEFPKGADKKALVPGCGSGYDVIYIASTLGYHATGLDISPTAIDRAISVANSTPDVPKDRISYRTENFFDLKPENEVDKYDLIYDYTFFVAIPPSRRPEWARQMINLIRPGGYLICVVFPIEPEKDYGPPWTVRPHHYTELLSGHFKAVVDRVPLNTPPDRVGRQHLLVWQRLG